VPRTHSTATTTICTPLLPAYASTVPLVSPSLQTLELALGCLGRVQPSSTLSEKAMPLSEKAMRKLPRWVQSRTPLGRRLAHQDIAEITRAIRASRAEAGPRVVHAIDTV
jgi:hypothetical protein